MKIMASMMVVLALFVTGMHAAATDDVSEARSFSQQQRIESHLIVNLFLDAVKRDGLFVFEQKITHDMIKPAQVAWVYETESDRITINIYSKLVKPVAIPHYEKFYIDGVSVNVSEDGEIIEVKAHVLPE